MLRKAFPEKNEMRKGKSAFQNAGTGIAAWVILISLSLIACGSDSAEPVSAKKAKSQPAAGQKAVNPVTITLEEYAALDEEMRMTIAGSFAEKNEQLLRQRAAREEEKVEKLPEGTMYHATKYDFSLVPTDTDVDSHLTALAEEKPATRVRDAAAAFITQKNIDVVSVGLEKK
ncbi:MAG: hypothetical protein JW832_18640 [Deltaproteobacteria bacterium]|nr:hypothetical protein [Deltaproteobacteria bacterium]